MQLDHLERMTVYNVLILYLTLKAVSQATSCSYVDSNSNENHSNRYRQIFLIPKHHGGQYLSLLSQIERSSCIIWDVFTPGVSDPLRSAPFCTSIP